MTDAPPAGYVRVTAGRCGAVVRAGHEADARALLAEGTPYEAAARDLGARPLAGRGVAYLIALPVSGTHAVVRHNRHGGLFARVTRDLFLPPTRAPFELRTSLRLIAAGIPTPPVLMYAVEARWPLVRRADVVTLAVEEARDLSTFMLAGESAATRAYAWAAVRNLVERMDAAGVRHRDLNVKNILLARVAGALEPWLLDVDRVEFTTPARARAGNRARLLRSARKWRDRHGAEFSEGADY